MQQQTLSSRYVSIASRVVPETAGEAVLRNALQLAHRHPKMIINLAQQTKQRGANSLRLMDDVVHCCGSAMSPLVPTWTGLGKRTADLFSPGVVCCPRWLAFGAPALEGRTMGCRSRATGLPEPREALAPFRRPASRRSPLAACRRRNREARRRLLVGIFYMGAQIVEEVCALFRLQVREPGSVRCCWSLSAN